MSVGLFSFLTTSMIVFSNQFRIFHVIRIDQTKFLKTILSIISLVIPLNHKVEAGFCVQDFFSTSIPILGQHLTLCDLTIRSTLIVRIVYYTHF